jgi:hypothetical protein
VAAVLIAVSLFIWVVVHPCYQRRTKLPLEADANTEKRCQDNVLAATLALENHGAVHHELPCSDQEPEIADPMRLLPVWPWAAVCPACAEADDGGRLVNSGYRMLNWTKGEWASALDALGAEPRRDSAQAEDVRVHGVPLLWCAEPAHRGTRLVVVLRPIRNLSFPEFLLPACRTLRMTEPEFQAMMGKWLRCPAPRP